MGFKIKDLLEQKPKKETERWCNHCNGTGLSGCDACLTRFRNDLEKDEPEYASLEDIPKVPCMYCKRADEAARVNCDHCDGTGWHTCLECFYNYVERGRFPVDYKDVPRVPCYFCKGSGVEGGRTK